MNPSREVQAAQDGLVALLMAEGEMPSGDLVRRVEVAHGSVTVEAFWRLVERGVIRFKTPLMMKVRLHRDSDYPSKRFQLVDNRHPETASGRFYGFDSMFEIADFAISLASPDELATIEEAVEKRKALLDSRVGPDGPAFTTPLGLRRA